MTASHRQGEPGSQVKNQKLDSSVVSSADFPIKNEPDGTVKRDDILLIGSENSCDNISYPTPKTTGNGDSRLHAEAGLSGTKREPTFVDTYPRNITYGEEGNFNNAETAYGVLPCGGR